MSKYLYIAANGCAVLRHETNRITRFFLLNGYIESMHPQEADIILFSTCGMTNEDVEFDIKTIRELLKIKKQDSMFIVTGCLPPVYDVKSISDNLIVIGYSELDRLDVLIEANVLYKDVRYNVGLSNHLVWPKSPEREEYSEDKKLFRKYDWGAVSESQMERIFKYSTEGCYIWSEKDIFQIRIAYGCSFACSYCSSTISVGDYHSVAIEDVLSQFRDGVNQGFTRFMLMGTELGMYGIDIDTNLVALIQMMHDITPNVEIGIRYIHPDCFVNLFDRLFEYMKEGYIYYFCVALQTASKNLLRLMNRNPNLTPFKNCIQKIRTNAIPIFIHSQIMVGFPGETYDDIFETLNLLDECDFNYVNMNKFSSRPMTQAYHLPGQINEDEKNRRLTFVKSWAYIRRQATFYKNLKGS